MRIARLNEMDVDELRILILDEIDKRRYAASVHSDMGASDDQGA